MLNSRMETILGELLADDGTISGSYLANINQVTTRTTRQDVKDLNGILEDFGATIDTVMGKGYRLVINDEKSFREYLKSTFTHAHLDTVPKTPEKRISYLLNRLLLSKDYLKLEDLADELFISKSTIQNDIKGLKQILNNYDIRIVSRPNYGLKVEGDEVKLRFCMSEFIFNRKEPISELYLDSVSEEDYKKISAIILHQINLHQITLSDIAINNLLIHILIAYKRIKSGNYVKMYKQNMIELTNHYEYQVASEIVKEVELTFHVIFPEEEIAYIAIHLLGTKLLTQSTEVVEKVIDDQVIKIVNEMLSKVEEKLNIGVKDDKELYLALTLHLKPALNRFKYGMNIRNPMLDDIKKNYPLAFEVGVIAGLAIEELTATKIDENEIGYIALHIGAAIERRKLKLSPKRCLIVCASGLGTAKLIFYKLKAHFGQNLDVIGTTEYYKLNSFNIQEIDFIVSSIPIPQDTPIPVIEVNAILTDTDLLKIENKIMEKGEISNHFIKDELVYLQQNLESMDEVFHFFDTKLREKKLVKDSFLEAMYEREKVTPTSFGNLVAIPHPIIPMSEETFLAVCTLTKPIEWKNKPVQLVFVLSVKRGSQEDLQDLYKSLGNLIHNRQAVQQLIKAKNYNEFITIFKI